MTIHVVTPVMCTMPARFITENRVIMLPEITIVHIIIGHIILYTGTMIAGNKKAHLNFKDGPFYI